MVATPALKLTVPGRPFPKARMTHRSKWGGRARLTLDYQKTITDGDGTGVYVGEDERVEIEMRPADY